MEPAAGNPLRRLLVPTLTLVAVALLGYFLWNQRAELQKAFETSWEYFVLLIVLNLVGQFVNATEYWMLYRAGGAEVDWTGNMSAYNAGQLGNYLPLQAGSVYRLHFMKQIYNVSYPRSVTTYAQNLVITVAAGGVCGLIGVFGTALTTGESFSWVMFGVSAGMCASALVFAFVPLPHANWLPGKVKHWWRDFHTGWELVRRRPRSALQVLAVESGRMILMAARIAVAFKLLGVEAPFVLYLVLAPVASVSTMLAFTPGALGIREAAVAGAALAMGFKLPTGLLAASVDRGAAIIVAVVLGAAGYAHTWYLLRQDTRRGSEPPTESEPPTMVTTNP